MTAEEQRADDVRWLNELVNIQDMLVRQGTEEEEEAESAADRFYGRLDREAAENLAARYRRILDALKREQELESSLDYVASCFHVAIHGVKDASTWRECERQPCRVASGRLPSVRRVGPSPATDATPDPEQETASPSP